MATTGIAPQISAQAGYNRTADCEPCWIRRKKPTPAIGKWGRVLYCEDCKLENEIDDDDEDWAPLPPPSQKSQAVAKVATPPPTEDPRFKAAEVAKVPEQVSTRSNRLPLPDQIPPSSSPAQAPCSKNPACPRFDRHRGPCRLPKPAKPPKAEKAPKETWAVPGSSTETPEVVAGRLGAAERLGREIREDIGTRGKARHARGEVQKAPAWALQFRELSEAEYAGIVPQRFLQKELEPIIEHIQKRHAELKKAGQEPKVRLVIDVPHGTISRHFRDRVARYMRLRKIDSHTEQVAKTNQIIVTAPAVKPPWGKRGNGKQPT